MAETRKMLHCTNGVCARSVPVTVGNRGLTFCPECAWDKKEPRPLLTGVPLREQLVFNRAAIHQNAVPQHHTPDSCHTFRAEQGQ